MQTVTRAQLDTAADTFFAGLIGEIDQLREFNPIHRNDEIAENI